MYKRQGTFTANAKGQLLPALKIVVEEFNIAANDNLATPYVRGRDLRLDLEAGEDLASLGDSLRARLTFKNASLPDLRVYNRYLPNHHPVSYTHLDVYKRQNQGCSGPLVSADP